MNLQSEIFLNVHGEILPNFLVVPDNVTLKMITPYHYDLEIKQTPMILASNEAFRNVSFPIQLKPGMFVRNYEFGIYGIFSDKIPIEFQKKQDRDIFVVSSNVETDKTELKPFLFGERNVTTLYDIFNKIKNRHPITLYIYSCSSLKPNVFYSSCNQELGYDARAVLLQNHKDVENIAGTKCKLSFRSKTSPETIIGSAYYYDESNKTVAICEYDENYEQKKIPLHVFREQYDPFFMLDISPTYNDEYYKIFERMTFKTLRDNLLIKGYYDIPESLKNEIIEEFKMCYFIFLYSLKDGLTTDEVKQILITKVRKFQSEFQKLINDPRDINVTLKLLPMFQSQGWKYMNNLNILINSHKNIKEPTSYYSPIEQPSAKRSRPAEDEEELMDANEEPKNRIIVNWDKPLQFGKKKRVLARQHTKKSKRTKKTKRTKKKKVNKNSKMSKKTFSMKVREYIHYKNKRGVLRKLTKKEKIKLLRAVLRRKRLSQKFIKHVKSVLKRLRRKITKRKS